MRCSLCLRVVLLDCHIHVDSYVGCPTPYSPIWCQRYFQAFIFQIIPYAFQPCLPGPAPWVTTNYDWLIYFSWPCVWIHTLKMTMPMKTPTSQYIFYATPTQSTFFFLWWYFVCKLRGADSCYHHYIIMIEMGNIFLCYSSRSANIQ